MYVACGEFDEVLLHLTVHRHWTGYERSTKRRETGVPEAPPSANGEAKQGARPANALSDVCFEVASGIPWHTVVAGYAFLVLQLDRPAYELDSWALQVLTQERRYCEMAADWRPPEDPAWQPAKTKPAAIFEPLRTACNGVSRRRDEWLAISDAIQGWSLPWPAQHDQLGEQKLKRLKDLQGPKLERGKTKPLFEYAAVPVAYLLLNHSRAMRQLLQADAPPPPPTQAEQIAQLTAKRLQARKEKDKEWKKEWKKAQEKLLGERLRETLAAKDAARKVAAAEKLERENDRLAAEHNELLEQRAREVAAARKRDREAEGDAALSQKRLKRAQRAEATLEKVRAQLEEVQEQQIPELDSESEEEEPRKLARHGAIEGRARRDRNGRWQAEDEDLHALRLAQLARGVPASTVPANVQDVLELIAPELDAATPCERSSQLQRGEVTLSGEAMAAWKLAACKRVMTFGWDESTKFGKAVFSVNFQLEMFDGSIEDVCPRGLTILPEGGTSKAVLNHIEMRILSYSRRILMLWKEVHEKMNGAGSWAAAGGPSPENIGLHRLCDDTVLMTDTCNGARCTKRMLAESIMRTIEEKVGKAVWDKMSTEERNNKYRVHRGDCWQHLRNIIIEAMAKAGDAHVKDLLEDDLADFSSLERIEVEGSSVIRSAFKEFHEVGEYVHGRGPEFKVWRVKNHKTSLFIPFERAMGSRQDLKFDGCVPLFWNRLICLEFLRGYINCPKSTGVLDKSLYIRLRSNEFVALLRVNVLWRYTFSEPFRWLAGKTSKLEGWSLFMMNTVLDLVDKAMQEIVADPKRLLDPALDVFSPIADQVPEFAKWRQEQLERTVAAEDGTQHLVMQMVLREARTPTAGSGNEQATWLTLVLAKKQAQAALDKMYDPKVALADKLESQGGANCFSKNKEAHEKTIGCDGTNDKVENKFATADNTMRIFRNISVLNTSGIVQQRAAHDFDRPLRVVSDRRKLKAGAAASTAELQVQQPGFFWRLSRELRRSLLRMVRRELSSAQKVAREEKRAHDEEKLARREEAVQRQLDAAVEKYAAALELYDAWRAQGVRDKRALEAILKELSPSQQLAELRHQIEMRTVGCGWRQFETKWTFFSDERHHTIEKLRSMLLDDILPHETALRRLKRLPAEAAPPQLTSHAIKALGTADADVLRLEATALFNVAGLKAKAEAARERREVAGISDRWEALQPKEPPAFDVRLVGKRLEVCWPYKEEGKTVKIWASGTVKRVADGLADKASARAKKILPAGALLWAWDADPERNEQAGEKWLVLLPNKWNKQVQYAWRFDPCELRPAGTPCPPPRAPHFEEGAPDDEFLDETQPHVPRAAKK